MSTEQPPQAAWQQAVIHASSVLATDADALNQVMSKLYRQYLPAAFRARTPEADLRVWSSLGYYLTASATSRKLFSLSPQEADGVVQAVRELVNALRRQG